MITNRLSFRSCNLCGETQALKLLYERHGYHIVRCMSCSLVYTNELPDDQELVALYSAQYYTAGSKYNGLGSASAQNAQEHFIRLKKLKDLRYDRWLDVGCATGDFLAAAQHHVSSLHGIEFSDYAVEQARKRGFSQVVRGTILDYDQNELYDLITFWDVLEHLEFPKQNLQKAFSLLRPGGYIAISTGNIESMFAKLSRRFWHLLTPPQHLYFFSHKTIRKMLQQVGFDNVLIASYGRKVAMDFLFRKLAQITFPALTQTALKAATALSLGKYIVRINLRDTMTVYAQKPNEN